uniref:Uncharacterized protein n=1 Tax=Parascaris equorum TaxID=6256 RepID=A0A914RLE6_PAREQ
MNALQHHGSSDSGSLPSRQAKGDGSDFIAWVESQGVGAAGSVGASSQQQHDDTDSVKSGHSVFAVFLLLMARRYVEMVNHSSCDFRSHLAEVAISLNRCF